MSGDRVGMAALAASSHSSCHTSRLAKGKLTQLEESLFDQLKVIADYYMKKDGYVEIPP